MKKVKTIEEATREWVREFNAIPQSVIIKLCQNNIDDIYELTTPENEYNYTDFLPMWGTMWTFGESLDEDWARGNIEIMQECGFRVYESDDFGIIFGIDGAGYNFYESHWIPLYKARGLKWHDEKAA